MDVFILTLGTREKGLIHSPTSKGPWISLDHSQHLATQYFGKLEGTEHQEGEGDPGSWDNVIHVQL